MNFLHVKVVCKGDLLQRNCTKVYMIVKIRGNHQYSNEARPPPSQPDIFRAGAGRHSGSFEEFYYRLKFAHDLKKTHQLKAV